MVDTILVRRLVLHSRPKDSDDAMLRYREGPTNKLTVPLIRSWIQRKGGSDALATLLDQPPPPSSTSTTNPATARGSSGGRSSDSKDGQRHEEL